MAVTYKTTAQIKTRLGITGSGDDTFIDSLRDAVYAQIALLIGYEFPGTTEARKFDWPGRGVVDLYVGYVHTITAVTNGDGVSFVEDTDYILRYDNTLRLKPSAGKYWDYNQDKEEAISVTATFGLPTTHDLYQIVVELEAILVEFLYRARDVGIPSEVSFTAGNALLLIPVKEMPMLCRMYLGMLKPVMV